MERPTPSLVLPHPLLLIDNYDSFTYNLYQYLSELGATVNVVRNDQITCNEIADRDLSGIVISPGPCTPDEAGISMEVIERFSGKIPILGVCLGHQSIVQVFGGKIIRAGAPVHGKASPVTHAGHALFKGLTSPFMAGRYHSLIADPNTIPDVLEVIASSEDEQFSMAVAHREHPTFGVQFHPESILTEPGKQLLANFIEICGDATT